MISMTRYEMDVLSLAQKAAFFKTQDLLTEILGVDEEERVLHLRGVNTGEQYDVEFQDVDFTTDQFFALTPLSLTA